MKSILKHLLAISLLLLPVPLFAWKWVDLWQTADQQGAKLLQAGKAQEASRVFENKDWQGTAHYRAGDYAQALQRFSENKTSDGHYNAGNADAFLGHYQEAIDAYDKAIVLNPDNADAITNRDIIKKLMNKKSPKKDSSNSANKDKQDKKDNQDNKPSSSGENTAQDNTQKSDADQKRAQNDSRQDARQQSQPQQADNSQPAQSGDNQMTDAQKQGSKQQEGRAPAASHSQTQDEDKKQLLRRLADDPGGLLRQKFLRDYFRRHSAGENPDQGGS